MSDRDFSVGQESESGKKKQKKTLKLSGKYRALQVEEVLHFPLVLQELRLNRVKTGG